MLVTITKTICLEITEYLMVLRHFKLNMHMIHYDLFFLKRQLLPSAGAVAGSSPLPWTKIQLTDVISIQAQNNYLGIIQILVLDGI